MILVTGFNGQLGFDVVKQLTKLGIECKGIDIADLDITKKEDVYKYITELKPEAVVHCAAYTAVDKAEADKELCYNINVNGTENIALACKDINAKMMYISTDYVFSGEGENFFEVDDTKAPLSVYGKTKYDGEIKVSEILDKYFVVRISWVFGKNGNNFVKTMLKLTSERDALTVVADQIGSPTYTADLAVLLCEMIVSEKYGTYHATNEGLCSWADFTREIAIQAGNTCDIKDITTAEYKTAAKRPANSRLSKKSLTENGFSLLPKWQDALKRYLEELA